jgi:hypothetical protein
MFMMLAVVVGTRRRSTETMSNSLGTRSATVGPPGPGSSPAHESATITIVSDEWTSIELVRSEEGLRITVADASSPKAALHECTFVLGSAADVVALAEALLEQADAMAAEVSP